MSLPDKLRYIGPRPDSLFSGRPLAPGDYLASSELTYVRDEDGEKTSDLEPHDGRLLDEGLLIDGEVVRQEEPVPPLEGQALEDALKARGLPKTGTADEKRARVAEHDANPPEEAE